MKFSRNWLNEWLTLPQDNKEFVETLARVGFEIDSIIDASLKFKGVVVGEIVAVNPVPGSDNLFNCKVSIDKTKNINIVVNFEVIENAKVAVATLDAQLPDINLLDQKEIHDVKSEGRICTERDLGLSEESQLVLFSADEKIGTDVYEIMDLNDQIIDLELTPNRGDCLSIKGLARELSVIYNKPYKSNFKLKNPKANHEKVFPIEIKEFDACPQFCTRIIDNVNNTGITPAWLKEKLRRGGIRSINPIVDITNYVMLEIGQPMHAYNLDSITGKLIVRSANVGEKLALLDNRTVDVKSNSLLIADDKGPVGLAGVMGGLPTSVDRNTKHIVLESAFFNPERIAGCARAHGLSTESSHRFERGVSPELQVEAIERASTLIQEIVGGNIGPVNTKNDLKTLPKPKIVSFRPSRAIKLLGLDVSDEKMKSIFKSSGFSIDIKDDHWDLTIPSYRFDIKIEVDLIEEIARIYGYENIPSTRAKMEMYACSPNEEITKRTKIKDCLKGSDYHECITYSFVDPALQKLLLDNKKSITLLNPIAPELSSMRISLWPGLLNALKHNQYRQMHRVRLFESGLCFMPGDEITQFTSVAGVASGSLVEEQWGEKARKIDFFDVKQDVENLLGAFAYTSDFNFIKASHNALHPGISAKITYKDSTIGWIGALSPSVINSLELRDPVILFELYVQKLPMLKITKYKNLSKYPALRRDLSFYVYKKVSSQSLIDLINKIDCIFLQKVSIFDIYEDKNHLEEKSVAISLTLQHLSRTLVDEEVSSFIKQVVVALQQSFQIKLRDK